MLSLRTFTLLLGFFVAGSPMLFAATYYVAPSGNNAAGGLTVDDPLATPQAAIDKALPGDTILLRGGVYPAGTGGMTFNAAKHRGSDQAWLTIKNYPGEKPVLRWDRAHAYYVGIWLTDAAYVEISGLTLEGWLDELTLDEARADAKAQKGSTIFNAGGIQADGRDTKKISRDENNRPHHFRIIGNTIRKFPGGGISFIECDDLLVENNTVEDCCWYSIWAGSGISIWQAWSLEPPSDDYRIRVIGNRLFGNKCLVEWAAVGALSDGNGIIIDDFRNTQNKSTRGVYNGRTLVANNLVVNNGGSGIHTFLSNNVDIVYNTAYHNGQVLDYGEIFALDSDSVRIINNICVAKPDRAINKLSKASTNVDYRNNLYCGGYVKAAHYAANNLTGEPDFLAPSIDPATADFRLGAASPAVDAGITANADVTYPWVASLSTDITGAPRSNGARPDLGAYERSGRSLPNAGLVITGNGEPILNGDAATNVDNQTSFPSTEIGLHDSEAPVHSFKLTNRDVIGHTISGITLGNTSVFNLIDPPNWPVVLAPGESTTFKVRFKPATSGNQAATVKILDATPVEFVLSGVGVSLPHAHLSVASLTATLPTNTNLTHDGLVLSNTGAAPLTWNITSSNSDVNPQVANGIIAPGQSEPIPVVFNSAQLTSGATASGTLNLTTDDLANPSLNLPVSLIIGDKKTLSPTIALTSPDHQITLQGLGSTLDLTASSSASTVAKIEFYDDSTLLGAVTTAPYTYKWVAATAGCHNITACVTDGFGTTASSQSVAVNVVNLPPAVQLILPTADTSLTAGAETNLTATATDTDGTISKVEFYHSGVLIGTATAAPYIIAWTPFECGPTNVYAKAYDDSDGVTVSAPINVSVQRPTMPTEGMIAGWGFDEGSGTSSVDFSGHGQSATIANATWNPAGRFGSAVILDGTEASKVTFEHPTIGAFSFSAWVNPAATATVTPVIFDLPGPGSSGANGYKLIFRRKNATQDHFDGLGFYDGTGGNWQTYGKLIIGTWYHLVVTFDGAPSSNGLTIYVDGVARKDTTNYGAFNSQSPGVSASTAELPGVLGNQVDGTKPFAGSIDQVRFYDHVLTPTEVNALFLDDGGKATGK